MLLLTCVEDGEEVEEQQAGELSKQDVAADEKLTEIRKRMVEEGIAALIVPSEDAHQSEYVSDRDQRRAWLSGFTGSAGTALVGRKSFQYIL